MKLAASALALCAFGATTALGDDCSTLKWPVDREAAAFSAPTLPQVVTGQPGLGLERAAVLKLARQSDVAFPVPPKRAPRSNPAYAGVFVAGEIPTGGRYTVTLSDIAWIDLVQDGKALKPEAFTDGKGCPNVRKSLRFDLAAGPLTVEISDAARDQLDIYLMPSTAP